VLGGAAGAHAEFALMKPSARLINTSRGPLVVEAALLDALGNRRISGAAIDVFDIEPLPEDHPYRRAENLLPLLISGMSRAVFTSAFIETALRTSARGLT
jgi:phosphoglycerate dehydrogenase-like enzyme